jgi:hypothetical protein
MEPLGTTKRALLLGIAIAAFIIILPVLFLYVSGFRLSQSNKLLIETGGIYIHRQNIEGVATISGGSLLTPLASTDALNQGLQPGNYIVRFAREKFTSWQKQVPVLPKKVTEIHPFQIPLEPQFKEIEQKITDANGIQVTNSQYTVALSYFTAPALKKKAPVTPETELLPERIQNKTRLFQFGTSLYAEWLGSEDAPPHYFCDSPQFCTLTVLLSRDIPKNATFEFFPDRDDIVLFTKVDGIYVSEIDHYGGHNEAKLVSGANLTFLVRGTILYVLEGKTIKTLDLAW